MPTRSFYHDGMIALQEQAAGRPIAEMLETVIRHETFTEDDKAFIEAAGYFFIATCFDNIPDCSFKGGDPGFVKVTGPKTLEFPDYDGNSMFRTLGNVSKNPYVALLFIAFGPDPKRLRLNGTATIYREPERLSLHEGAKAVVEVECTDLFPNCPRYIPDLVAGEGSAYNPRPGATPPVPEWKTLPQVTPLLPDGDMHRAQVLADRNSRNPSS
jgi:hypothetical protein